MPAFAQIQIARRAGRAFTGRVAMNTPRVLVVGVLVSGTALTQNLLPNPRFEEGTTSPAGWLLEGAGEWAHAPAAGTNRVLCVRGGGGDSAVWRTGRLPLQPGGLYVLRFRGRRLPDASGGTAVSGSGAVNRDFPLGPDWGSYAFVFRQPDNGVDDFMRLGHWHVRGALEFDDTELWPVRAVHRRVAWPGGPEEELGEGEVVLGGRYQFSADLGWFGANAHRPLVRATARFNSDRWLFQPGAEVVYRFAPAGRAQTAVRVRAGLNHHEAGGLEVQFSRDGVSWSPLGRLDGARRAAEFVLPEEALPATEVWVRLHAVGAETSLQLNRLDYEAVLAGELPEVFGETRFIEVTGGARPEAVDWEGWSGPDAEGRLRLHFRVPPSAAVPQRVTARLGTTTAGVRTGRPLRLTVAPGQGARGVWTVTWSGRGVELIPEFRDAADQLLLAGRLRFERGFLDDADYGHRLPAADDLDLWWCESGWKVGRHRALPSGPLTRAVSLSLARGEFEPVQVVLRPRRAGQLQRVEVGPFRGAAGREVPLEVTVHEVAYVPVLHPTDATCRRGWYPDPLPPLEPRRRLVAGENVPLWITVYAPREVPAGEYRGELRLVMDASGPLRVPLVVRVYGFELPRETHLRSALGLGWDDIQRYHRLTNRADQVAVLEKYLQNFAEHRISPYSFFDHAPIEVRFEGEGAGKRARVDFRRFDAAASRWLDGQGLERGSPFNAFRLPLHGMGGGTFHSRHLGGLEGFREGTPEHARLFADYLGQVERHLRERGWLDRAFTYWFDEPDPKDYEFVIAGQQRIRAAAPGLKRMLTEQPEPELLGHVDLWCALTPEWTPEKVRARRAAGEEVWWYICTVPRAPYLTEFIDHPGTELRLWPWQSWQYGVDGILIWATTYWHSPEAYPDRWQDPWQDPMSWVTSYGTPRGARLPWGNGDGRFLYPPRRDPNTATTPCLDGPINSIRWENLRDGIEDYEYFWLLDQAIRRTEEQRARDGSGKWKQRLAEARALLAVPEHISKDLTHFTLDPRPMLEHRERLARMIEALR